MAIQVFEKRSVEADPPKPWNSAQRPNYVVEGPSDPGKILRHRKMLPPRHAGQNPPSEFNQAEGIVLDPSLNLRNLLGILEMFAKEVAGADKVRFKPDYFPFTEPSVELQAYRVGFGGM